MPNTVPALDPIKNGFSPTGQLIRAFSSNHGRRIMFVTSLYFRIKRLDRLKADAIAKLNAIMHLSSTDEAMRLPALISGFVWRNIPIDQVLTQEALDQDVSEAKAARIAEQVVSMMPKWARYDGKESMESDVFNLVMGCTREDAVAA